MLYPTGKAGICAQQPATSTLINNSRQIFTILRFMATPNLAYSKPIVVDRICHRQNAVMKRSNKGRISD